MSPVTDPAEAESPNPLKVVRINETRYSRVYTADEITALIRRELLEEARISPYAEGRITSFVVLDTVSSIAVELVVEASY